MGKKSWETVARLSQSSYHSHRKGLVMGWCEAGSTQVDYKTLTGKKLISQPDALSEDQPCRLALKNGILTVLLQTTLMWKGPAYAGWIQRSGHRPLRSGKLELKMSHDTTIKGLLGETRGDGKREEIQTGTDLSTRHMTDLGQFS